MAAIIIFLALFVAVIAGIWMAFAKAGAPGWAAIVPFYNFYIMTKMAGKPAWWLLLMFIPLVSIVVLVIMSIEIAKGFGKSEGFGIGLGLLGFVFWPILGFGAATWQKAPVGS